MKESTLKFLGRGSAFNAKEGNNSAYYIDENNNMLLIDCGSTVFSRLIELELLDKIKSLTIIITHMHQDHCGSISTLLEYINAVYPDMKVKLYSFRDINCPETYTFELMGIRYGLNKNIELEERALYGGKHAYCVLLGLSLMNQIIAYAIISDHDAIIYNSEDSYIHNQAIPSAMLCIKIKNKILFYSSDIKEFDPDKIISNPFIPDISLIDEFYIDAVVRTEFNGNKYPHANIYNTFTKCKENDIPIEQVWLMHLDCDGVEQEGKDLGFNIVRNV